MKRVSCVLGFRGGTVLGVVWGHEGKAALIPVSSDTQPLRRDWIWLMEQRAGGSPGGRDRWSPGLSTGTCIPEVSVSAEPPPQAVTILQALLSHLRWKMPLG